VPALPIDLFRVLVGVLSAVYFVSLAREAADFSGPDGLIDHLLAQQIFWYTKLGLFQPWMNEIQFKVIFGLAALASVGLAAGYRPKLMAAFMFVVAVSAYRWNFLVIYVDDGIMHLAMFWMLLLPIGRTLVLGEWLRDKRRTARWRVEMVPGEAVHAFLVSLSLVYIVAGLWKWTSPMWRSGVALYAVLHTPIAWAPDWWQLWQWPMIRGADFTTLVFEPLFPLMFILPTNHRIKWALLPLMIGFHAGIISTMRVPYANIACIAAAVVVFREEIMGFIGARISPRRGIAQSGGICPVASLAFVTVLTLAMMGEAAVPSWRGPNRSEELTNKTTKPQMRAGFLGTQHNPLYIPLWLVGIAQSYRLFDWIDDRNFHVSYNVVEHRANGIDREVDPRDLFPSTIRGVLLQTYLHDVTWGSIPRERADELKLALYARFTARYCRNHGANGEIDVQAVVARVSLHGPQPTGPMEPLLRFRCEGVKPRLRYARLGSDSKIARAAPLMRPASLATSRR
jgi:hypothetical protein